MRYKKQIVSIMTLAILLILMMSTTIQAVSLVGTISKFDATLSGSQIKLAWSSISNIAGYNVYVNGTKIGSVSTNEASLIGFSENTTYRLRVTAYDSAKVEVATSNEINFTTTVQKNLEKVKDLTVIQVNGYVTLNWTGVNHADRYQVFVDVPGFGNVNIGEVTSTNAMLRGFTDGLKYGFSVRACQTLNSGNINYGEKSEAQYIVIDYNKDDTNQDNNNPTKPDKVEGVKIYNVEETTATISWSEVKNVDGYEVRLSKNYGKYEVVSDTNKKEVSLKKLDADSYYRVKIVAYKWANGNKVYGDEATYHSFTTKEEKIVVGSIKDIDVDNIEEKEVTVSWGKADNADGYEVLLSKNRGTYKVVYDTSKREVYLSNLDSSTYYRVKVVAYKWVNGKKQYGEESSYRAFNTKDEKVTPDKVRIIYIDDVTKNSATIGWREVDNADGYEVLLSKNKAGYKNICDTTKSEIYLSNLDAGAYYRVKVVAYKWVNGKKQYGEESSYNDFETKNENITIDNVSTININDITKNSASISWSSVSGATGYHIYLAQDGEEYEYQGATSSRNYTFENLESNTYYKVKIEAYKTVNGKKYVSKVAKTKGFTTKKVVIVVKPTKPATVTGLSVTVKNKNQAQLTWKDVDGVTGYEVWISKSGGAYQRFNWTTDNSATLDNLSDSTNYKVKIRAYKNYTENGEKKTIYGEYSSIKSFKTQSSNTTANSTNIATVTGVKVTKQGSKVTLTWKAVTGVAGYEVDYTIPNVGHIPYYTTTNSKTISGVTGKKSNYTARVRAYKYVNGVKKYGPYSEIVTFKGN